MNGRGRVPERVMIVDGYNVINARRHVTGSMQLADARDQLIREMQDYAGYSGQRIILVFDAWQGDRDRRSREKYGAVEVVFTQKGEIADHYIERLCDEMADDIDMRRMEVRVATSDALEQTIVLGRGATRISSRELLTEMGMVRGTATARQAVKPMGRTTIGDRLGAETVERMRAIARSEK
ncbi:MAG: NYN domain-containing protein [Clostridiales bacterium]|nr:NYN domain-containing protein [Clostridiales bacterium]